MNNFRKDVQELFLRMMISEPSLYIRASSIFNSKNFDKSLQPVCDFIVEFSSEYNSMPDSLQIKAKTGVDIQHIDGLRDSDCKWFLDEFEQFTRNRELERAILKSADLLEKNTYAPVEKLIKDAIHISLQKDIGTNYYADPRTRLEAIKNNNGQVSTGWPVLDRKLYGGFNRGELQIFAGGSGSGKSLFMQNLAVNWSQQRLNGAYITLELSEDLCSLRLDSMMTDTPSREVLKSIDDIELKVKMQAKKNGKLFIKYLPAQSTVNDIRSYIKTLQIETLIKIDYVCIDYLDLLMPVSAKVSPNDLFIKDKYVSEEIRNLARELNVLLVTASQLNRSAVEEIEFDHSHISGGISKINTADNLFGIFTSRNMRERGQYQLQLMKTRSSSGVGQKIDLTFNNDTLRIYDNLSEEEHEKGGGRSNTSNFMSKIKTQSNVVKLEPSADAPPPPTIDKSLMFKSNLDEEPEYYGDTGKAITKIKSNALREIMAKMKK